MARVWFDRCGRWSGEAGDTPHPSAAPTPSPQGEGLRGRSFVCRVTASFKRMHLFRLAARDRGRLWIILRGKVVGSPKGILGLCEQQSGSTPHPSAAPTPSPQGEGLRGRSFVCRVTVSFKRDAPLPTRCARQGKALDASARRSRRYPGTVRAAERGYTSSVGCADTFSSRRRHLGWPACLIAEPASDGVTRKQKTSLPSERGFRIQANKADITAL